VNIVPHMTRFAPIPLVCFLAASCTLQSPPSSAPFARTSSLEWRNAKWTVSLQRQPYRQSEPAPNYLASYYLITFQGAGKPITLRATSAFDDDRQYTSDDRVATNLELLADPSSDTLLIHEAIPNDCCPCDNYLLVRKSANRLEPRWLRIPSRLISKTDEFETEPTIVAITNDTLWYRFADQKVEKVKIDTLEATTGPLPPG